MGKVTVLILHTDDSGNPHEWQATYDTEEATGLANTKGFIDRVRLLVRRELIRRGLITATDEDNKRVR